MQFSMQANNIIIIIIKNKRINKETIEPPDQFCKASKLRVTIESHHVAFRGMPFTNHFLGHISQKLDCENHNQ